MNHRDTPSEQPAGNEARDALFGGSLEHGSFEGSESMMLEPVGLRARVLAVSPRRSVRRRIASMLHGRVESIEFVESASEALEHINTSNTDLVIIERALTSGDGIELLETITHHHPMIVGVVLGAIQSTDDAVRAMRAGACDLIQMSSKEADTVRRLVGAAERAERVRRRDARVDRLKKLCNKLNNAREEVTGQIGGLCTDLTDAYKDLTQQFGDVKIRSELETLLRQELDIESLLRTLLEFTLSKIGPTNAAVFMPTSGGDYSVGAYVNYDIAKETAEVMLDQLADAIPESVEHLEGVRAMSGRVELTEMLGTSAYWVEDSTMLTISCREDDECLAVLALFRDRSRSFGEEDVRMLGIIGSLFGDQLARVIQTHHRHLPRDQWGLSGDYGVDDEPGDDYDFDDGYGDDYGGFAA
jgi:DNA-binding NarL/FixJ family response regulator